MNQPATQSELSQSELHILDSFPTSAVVFDDSNGDILYTNTSARTLFGLEAMS